MAAKGKPRNRPTLHWESKAGHPSSLVAGVDEVGRGCLAGPVVAAAVILPDFVVSGRPKWLSDVKDSKLLTAEARQELAPLITAFARSSFIASASVEEIDQINIYHASHLAMVRAIEGLHEAPDHVLVDGNVAPKGLKAGATAIIGGDRRCLSIACASILAKVWRDAEMARLEAEYPGYGFAAHKGYGTPVHQEALKRLGVTLIHRRSFAPVAELIPGAVPSEPTPVQAQAELALEPGISNDEFSEFA